MNSSVITTASPSTMAPVGTPKDPADPSTTVTPQQVTQWVDDAAIQTATLPSHTVPAKEVLSAGVEDRIHTVVDVLERPVKIGTFEWADTDAFDASVFSASFPEDLLSNAPNLVDKINHFTFLRSNVVIRIVVNANTFQCGRLVAYFSPFSSSADIGERTEANDFMSARTVFPRIILDAASGNTGELTIPYVSYFTHYDLSRGLGDLGTVDVRVLNPLQSGTCTVSVFARFVDNSLEIPTAVPNNLGSYSSIYNAVRSYAQPISKAMSSRILSAISESIGKELPKAQVGEAEKKASSGVISSTLDTLGSGLTTAGAVLPGYGKLLIPVGWIAKAAAGVASFFGYSKSNTMSDLHKYVDIPAWGFTNSDGVDNSVVLGNSLENYIGPRSDLFGSALDEMDVAFIAKHECYLESFKWTLAGNPGTVLYDGLVSPGLSSLATEPLTNPPVYNPTAMGYLSSMFRYWRGGIRFKIQVTKTAYHSGRLRISFIPGGAPGVGGYRVDQGYSEVLDLRTSDELDVTIPFVSNTVWKTCELHTSNGSLLSFTGASGILRVEVLNSLRAPDNVANELFCNVWVSAADDIQFAIPDFAKYMPTNYEPEEEMPRAQVLGQFKDAGFNDMSAPKMFSTSDTPPVEASALAIGEHVCNLRPLLRRFGYVGTYALDESTDPNIGAVFSTSNYFSEPAPYGETATFTHFSPVDYISYLYRFFRGGSRFKAVTRTSEPGATFATIEPASISPPRPFAPVDSNALDIVRTALQQGSAFVHLLEAAYNRILEVLVPYYSNTHISLVRGASALVDNTMDRASLVFFSGPNERVLDIFKSTADDFTFGWLVGPPRLTPRLNLSSVIEVDFTKASGTSFTGGETDRLLVLFEENIGTGSYELRNNAAGTVDVVFDMGAERPADLTFGTAFLNGSSGYEILFVVEEGSGGMFDPAATLANVQALGVIPYFYSNGPPPPLVKTRKKNKKKRNN